MQFNHSCIHFVNSLFNLLFKMRYIIIALKDVAGYYVYKIPAMVSII